MDFKQEPGRIYMEDQNGNLLAEILFPDVGDGVVDITRTYVDDSLRGQGIAGKLMEAALQTIAAEGKKIIPSCSYAAGWFEKHPEKADLKAQ